MLESANAVLPPTTLPAIAAVAATVTGLPAPGADRAAVDATAANPAITPVPGRRAGRRAFLEELRADVVAGRADDDALSARIDTLERRVAPSMHA